VTKRISLVFDLPDDDMVQVNDMLLELLETFSETTHLFEVRDPSRTIENIALEVVDFLPPETLETFQDMVTCKLIPDWNKHKADPNKNMATIIDIGILLDFIADSVMDEIIRRS